MLALVLAFVLDEEENPFLVLARFNWLVVDDRGTRSTGSEGGSEGSTTNACDVVCMSWSVAIHVSSTALDFNGVIIVL